MMATKISTDVTSKAAKVVEKKPAILLGSPHNAPMLTECVVDERPSRVQATSSANRHSRNSEKRCHSAALAALFFAGVEQHDGNQEQNHDRSGIDDHLNSARNSAPNSRYSQRATITTINDNALLMDGSAPAGSPPATQIVAKKK